MVVDAMRVSRTGRAFIVGAAALTVGSAALVAGAANAARGLPLRTVADVALPGPSDRFDYTSIDPAARRLWIAHMDAGTLLAFTFSFDDYVITYFVSGAGTTTLPLYVFSTIRKGVTPATNAVAAVMLLITLTVLVVGQFLVWRNARRSGQRGAQASVAGMIAEQSG